MKTEKIKIPTMGGGVSLLTFKKLPEINTAYEIWLMKVKKTNTHYANPELCTAQALAATDFNENIKRKLLST